PAPATARGPSECVRLTVEVGQRSRHVGEPAKRRSLILHAERQADCIWPEGGLLTLLSAIAGTLAMAFDTRVLSHHARRQQMIDRLSPRQRQVVELLATGNTEREIALALKRSQHTIHDHIKTIYRTLGVASRRAVIDLWRDEAGATPE